MKRDSKYLEYSREKPVGGRLYRTDIEPVLELCTDYGRRLFHTGCTGIRPLQRQSIEDKSVLFEVHIVRYG